MGASPTIQTPESHEWRSMDHDIRLLPKLGDDRTNGDSILLAFDSQSHEPLTDNSFAYSLDRTLGVHAESGAEVPLLWVYQKQLLSISDPSYYEKIKNAEQLGGYFGIRLRKEGLDRASDEAAAAIAALISEVYKGDEQLRALHNYTLDAPADPIEITGPGYNLSEEATAEHPTVDLEQIVQQPVSLRHLEIAPELARVSFA